MLYNSDITLTQIYRTQKRTNATDRHVKVIYIIGIYIHA